MTVSLVFVHGLLDDAAMWDWHAAHLSDIATVTAPDILEPETIGEAAAHVLDQAPDTFALAGFSMGGYIAFEILRRAPERVTHSALISTSSRADTPERIEFRQGQIVRAQSGDLAGVIDDLMPNAVHPDRLADVGLTREIRDMGLRVGTDAFVRQEHVIISRPDSRPGLGAIGCPTLVTCGRQDALTPPELSEEMAAGIPGARFVPIEECGHYAPLERHHAVNALLREWLTYA